MFPNLFVHCHDYRYSYLLSYGYFAFDATIKSYKVHVSQQNCYQKLTRNIIKTLEDLQTYARLYPLWRSQILIAVYGSLICECTVILRIPCNYSITKGGGRGKEKKILLNLLLSQQPIIIEISIMFLFGKLSHM